MFARKGTQEGIVYTHVGVCQYIQYLYQLVRKKLNMVHMLRRSLLVKHLMYYNIISILILIRQTLILITYR